MIEIDIPNTDMTVKCKPENAEIWLDAMAKAGKIQSPKQFRARVAAKGNGREFPKWTPGRSVADYVTDYYTLNFNAFHPHYAVTPGIKRHYVKSLNAELFEPLNDLPCMGYDPRVPLCHEETTE